MLQKGLVIFWFYKLMTYSIDASRAYIYFNQIKLTICIFADNQIYVMVCSFSNRKVFPYKWLELTFGKVWWQNVRMKQSATIRHISWTIFTHLEFWEFYSTSFNTFDFIRYCSIIKCDYRSILWNFSKPDMI